MCDNEPTDRAGRRPERHADADLSSALAHEARDHAKHTCRREHECQRGERRQHAAREPLLCPRAAKLLGEQANIVEREVGVDALQRIADAADVLLILILSDINMPGMTGLELLPKAKALRPDVPVIMITAYGDADTKRKALENGAETLFTKPIDFGALRSEIDLRIERAA